MFSTHKIVYGKYMMTTNWTLPSLVTQYAEDESHIPWNEVDDFSAIKTMNGKGTSTASPLLHIARQPRNDIKMKTHFLKATGFNFINLPDTISGITCKVTMNRHGRIADETVQLTYNGELIGENYATTNLNPISVYGGEADKWKITDINTTMIQDSSFGIVLRFRSHPQWPHSTTPTLYSIELQVH